jgi:protein Mpv17
VIFPTKRLFTSFKMARHLIQRHLHDVGHAAKFLFDNHPRIVSACTGLCTFALGDVFSQTIRDDHRGLSDKPKTVDYQQSARVGGLGFLMNGVFLPNWYNFLDRVLGNSMKSKTSMLMKVAADQFIYAPFTIASYFGFSSYIHNGDMKNRKDIFVDRVAHSLFPTWLVDCTIWPLANAVNFHFVPLIFRPIFTAVVQLVWQTYLAFVSKEEGNAAH